MQPAIPTRDWSWPVRITEKNMNRFRTKVKKLSKFSGHEKGASDPSSIKPSVVGAGGPGSPAFLGVSSKENRRKAASVSGPPEVSSPVHQVKEYLKGTIKVLVIIGIRAESVNQIALEGIPCVPL